jgi:hypothetical protein
VGYRRFIEAIATINRLRERVGAGSRDEPTDLFRDLKGSFARKACVLLRIESPGDHACERGGQQGRQGSPEDEEHGRCGDERDGGGTPQTISPFLWR